MALRLIEMVLKEKNATNISDLFKKYKVIEYRHLKLLNGEVLVRILLDAEQSESLLDLLEKNFSIKEKNRVVILPVEATLPRYEEEPSDKKSGKTVTQQRMNREELYQEIKKFAQCSWIYLAMMSLSTIVAMIGLLENNVPIIIGAMVIAPMLGPNMALELSATLGDLPLLWRALLTSLAGIAVVVILSTFMGALIHVDPTIYEIASRTKVVWGDVAVAFASGCAGALALTTGVAASLVGVMVAVSLLPPLVTFGLLLGSGNPELAVEALALFLTNLICVNISGVSMFVLQGIKPVRWREKQLARKTTWLAVVLWLLLLLTLFVIILLLHGVI